jgi:hypothetical protein
MAQKAILDPDLSYDLSDTFLGQSDDQIGNSLPKTSCEADAKLMSPAKSFPNNK